MADHIVTHLLQKWHLDPSDFEVKAKCNASLRWSAIVMYKPRNWVFTSIYDTATRESAVTQTVMQIVQRL